MAWGKGCDSRCPVRADVSPEVPRASRPILLSVSEQTDLLREWLNRLADVGLVDLEAELAAFPELEQVLALPELQTTVQEGSFLTREGEFLHGEVSVEWRHPSWGEVGTLGLDFDGEEGAISLEDMHLVRQAQERGLGRAVLLEVVDLADQLGFEALKAMASGAGRYAWARCGFDFFDDEVREEVLEAAATFAARLGRPFDGAHIGHSWDLAELAGDPVPLAQFAAARGDPPPGEGAGAMRFGQALLLGPTDNDWAGLLDVRLGSPGRIQLEKPRR
jgi:GNAT superfamily N-acetyltransferase